MSAIAVHEASHAAVAMALGQHVEFVERTLGHVLRDERAGFASISLGEGIEPSRLCVALAGYWATGRQGWPPPYELAQDEELEALGTIIRVAELDREDYDALVDLTRRTLDVPPVRRFRDGLAMALDHVPRIYEPEILAIAEAVGFIPQRKEQHELQAAVAG